MQKEVNNAHKSSITMPKRPLYRILVVAVSFTFIVLAVLSGVALYFEPYKVVYVDATYSLKYTVNRFNTVNRVYYYDKAKAEAYSQQLIKGQQIEKVVTKFIENCYYSWGLVNSYVFVSSTDREDSAPVQIALKAINDRISLYQTQQTMYEVSAEVNYIQVDGAKINDGEKENLSPVKYDYIMQLLTLRPDDFTLEGVRYRDMQWIIKKIHWQ